MQFTRNSTILIIVTFVGCFLIFQAALTSLASVNYYSAKAQLENWSNEPTSVTEPNYQQALLAAKRAYELQPSLALYSDTVSEVLQWGVYAGFNSSSEKVYSEALMFNSHSLSLRPSWAVTWVNAAYIKWQLDDLDEDFYLFLARSGVLGRNAQEVNLFYLEFGLYLVDSDLRTFFSHQKEIERRANLVLKSNLTRARAVKIIKTYKKEYLVCSWLDASDNDYTHVYRRLCN